MPDRHVADQSTTEGLPIAPSLWPVLEAVHSPLQLALVTPRVLGIAALAVATGLAAGLVAQGLGRLIALITNLSFFGRLSVGPASPADNTLGAFVIVVPVAGALVVGLMARYGSAAIRGHGIPEAMEQVLFNQSRIPARMTCLKPLSAAVSIGTGGPFGAEGPIIATGGALGSLVGQVLTVTSDERKTLLAAGAAAGMSATFGSPVSAVLLAVELLLFEYQPRSVIPVALASVAACAVHVAFVGSAPMFALPDLVPPGSGALAIFVLLGAVVGAASVVVTRTVYAIEDLFEKLPLHWMWWPAIGAVAVGTVGYLVPRTMGVGYDNIEDIAAGRLAGSALLLLTTMKFVSWSISLGSGTSGGTLAPLLTIGAGIGVLLTTQVATLAPGLALDPRVGALVGMAAMFAGASRAMLASVVFAFEITRQPLGLLPLLGGCSAAHLVSCFLMRDSIMTEKLSRRGARVPSGYSVDFLGQVLVRDVAASPVVTLPAGESLDSVRRRIAEAGEALSHQGFPVIDEHGHLVGVVTRRDLLDTTTRPGSCVRDRIRRRAVVTFDDNTLREAADHMVREGIGRLPVVTRGKPRQVVGMVTRSDLLMAHRRRLHDSQGLQTGSLSSRRGPVPAES